MAAALQFLFANNAQSTLAASISAGATTVTLAAGTGTLFPSPGAGQQFALTFISAITGIPGEIVYCTARSADTLTIMRGQEGTTAQSWNVNDLAANFITSGQAAQFLQNNIGGTFTGNQINLNGAGSGTISIIPQSVAGTYNLNLPTSAGTSGFPLLSGGGGSAPMTWGSITGTGNFALSSGATVNNWTLNGQSSIAKTGTLFGLEQSIASGGHFLIAPPDLGQSGGTAGIGYIVFVGQSGPHAGYAIYGATGGFLFLLASNNDTSSGPTFAVAGSTQIQVNNGSSGTANLGYVVQEFGFQNS